MLAHLILLGLFIPVLLATLPESPCPEVFTYHQATNLYGEIVLPYNSNHLELAVNVSLVGLYQHKLSVQLELLTPTNQVQNGVKYRVNFPNTQKLPKITEILYNGRIYCSGPEEPLSEEGVTNLWANLNHRIGGTNRIPTTTTTTTTTLKPEISKPCGIANSDIQTLIVDGDDILDNEFPWLVAMFRRMELSYKFQCTANLISERHVITAGHCVQFYKVPLIEKEDILLVMGQSDLTFWASSGATLRTVSKVSVHPKYRQNSGHFDVAVIQMNEEVHFQINIRPVCLWSGAAPLRGVVGQSGIVIGWGKDETGRQTTSKPKKTEMPIVSQEVCLRSHLDFRNLTSEMTFCAGNQDGSGPCSGDSGAGLDLKQNGKYYLRGVVSTALINSKFTCDLDQYVVFADVARMHDWISTTMT